MAGKKKKERKGERKEMNTGQERHFEPYTKRVALEELEWMPFFFGGVEHDTETIQFFVPDVLSTHHSDTKRSFRCY